jgi:hypothetical protein
VSNRALDKQLARENYVDEVSCCECGYHRNGRHHPKIRCSKTGRCGECGNEWPCDDHALKEQPTDVDVAQAIDTVNEQYAEEISKDAAHALRAAAREWNRRVELLGQTHGNVTRPHRLTASQRKALDKMEQADRTLLAAARAYARAYEGGDPDGR